MNALISKAIAATGALIALAIMGVVMIAMSQRQIVASANPITTYSASGGSKCQPQADLRALKAKHFKAGGTLDLADAKVKRWFRTTDSRNFSVEVSVADLETTYVSAGRQFASAEQTRRVILIVSHGNFDAGRDGVMGQGMIGGQGSATSLSMQSDLDVLMIDARTGEFFAEALMFPNCHRD
ncbi:MAG: hypothetical protein DME52_13075 [Verrucomicrobia bacterium]|nr:MAG: hypothetical protein DME52_13075 [Verrucomicrobiota bacterium]